MEEAQQRTGWPIGRREGQESGGRLGATPENTGMLGRAGRQHAVRRQGSHRSIHQHHLQRHATQPLCPGKATKRERGTESKHPANKGTAKNATAQPAPAQELVKASRQASNGRGKREAALKEAGDGARQGLRNPAEGPKGARQATQGQPKQQPAPTPAHELVKAARQADGKATETAAQGV